MIPRNLIIEEFVTVKSIKIPIYFLCFIIISILSGCETIQNDNTPSTKYITVGTGSVSGVYYPAGMKIAEIINKTSDNKIKATAKTAYNSSIFNIIDVLNGDITCGIAQNNDLFSHYQNAPNGNKLRALFTLHTEMLTILASQDAGIREFKDLKGKSVRLGPTPVVNDEIKEVIETEGLKLADIKQVQAKSVLCPNLIQKGTIDAYFFTVGHPNMNTEEALKGKRHVNVLPLSEKSIEDLLKLHPYYTKASIPLNYYKVGTGQLDTIGVKAVLFTSEDADEETIYQLTKYVFTNLDKLKDCHRALSMINEKDMIPVIRPPIHKGALRYYKEVGLK